jgi:putative addiction module killer protein
LEPQQHEVLHCVIGGRDVYAEWLEGLRDAAGRAVISKRIRRITEGNFGDHRFVGEGVWEIRIHFGPGYRLYYGEDGPNVVLLLCGGDKGTQQKDIRRAQEFWAAYGRGK